MGTKKFVSISLIILSALFLYGCQEKSAETDAIVETSTATTVNIIQKQSTNLTLQELSAHNSESSCYVAYEGEVFDITNFLSKHPGGKTVLLNVCGTAQEFQNAFIKKHATYQVSKLRSEGKLAGTLVPT